MASKILPTPLTPPARPATAANLLTSAMPAAALDAPPCKETHIKQRQACTATILCTRRLLQQLDAHALVSRDARATNWQKHIINTKQHANIKQTNQKKYDTIRCTVLYSTVLYTARSSLPVSGPSSSRRHSWHPTQHPPGSPRGRPQRPPHGYGHRSAAGSPTTWLQEVLESLCGLEFSTKSTRFGFILASFHLNLIDFSWILFDSRESSVLSPSHAPKRAPRLPGPRIRWHGTHPQRPAPRICPPNRRSRLKGHRNPSKSFPNASEGLDVDSISRPRRSGAMSPSIENTPSVTIMRCRVPWATQSFKICSRWAMSR